MNRSLRHIAFTAGLEGNGCGFGGWQWVWVWGVGGNGCGFGGWQCVVVEPCNYVLMYASFTGARTKSRIN
jgi:hypothetical protein